MTPLHYRDTVRNLVFGIGVILALYIGATTLPVFGLIGVFVLPLPVLVYRLKLGRTKGAAVPAVSFVVMTMLSGGGSLDLFLFLALLMLGFVLGESFERNYSLEKTMAIACGSLTLAGLIVLLFYSHMAGVGIPDLVSSYVSKNLALSQAAFNKMNVTEETKQALSSSIELIKYMAVRLLPGITVSGILFMAWVTLLLARPVFHRIGLPYPAFGQLIRWRAPEILVWGVIGCGAFLLVPVNGLKLIGINGLMILLQVYFFQGIAIISYFFEKKRIPVIVRWCLYILMTLQLFFVILVIGLGLFDTWLNLRKLGTEGGEPSA